MRNTLLAVIIIIIGTVVPPLDVQAEEVTVKEDKDGVVVTREDGSKEAYGTGYTVKEVKETHESWGDKVTVEK